ncbi:hypothetical protein TNCV_3358241 [Trichonephila clavipes]|nr:hypothetical protein TNCV_3358241 [Trichonephila clavipes]
MNSIAAWLPRIAIPSDTVAIVRVQYFVRGGFVGYRSRASSKHLSPDLPVDELDSSGVKKGLRCRCKMHVWVSGPQRNRLDVDVWRSDVTRAISAVTFVKSTDVGEHSVGGQGPPTSFPLPPTSRVDLRLGGYLEYPMPQRHYTFTNNHVLSVIRTQAALQYSSQCR